VATSQWGRRQVESQPSSEGRRRLITAPSHVEAKHGQRITLAIDVQIYLSINIKTFIWCLLFPFIRSFYKSIVMAHCCELRIPENVSGKEGYS